ncbi:MAG: response regulator [Desulfobulbaceae bacterium]|nr:response regulator [Desulfobulbaceae bacterium]
MKQRILAVDDQSFVADMAALCLTESGYECDVAASAQQALALLGQNKYDLMITDVMMPDMSGIELLGQVKMHFPNLAVLMATGVNDRKTAIQAIQLGAYGYLIKPFSLNEFLINVANALERARLTRESRDCRNILEEEVRERTAEVRRREEEIALRLISAAGHRDEETGEHIKRIGLYSVVLAAALGWDEERIDHLRVGAPMHDVGKIGIPDHILRKPGRLSAEEYQVIKQHPRIGAGILGGSKIPLLQTATDIALCHHEKWDGSGYPAGLKGKEIPEAARVVAIADVYDALSNDRVYRAMYPEKEVLEIMEKKKGSHFDPEIFDCFLTNLPALEKILHSHQDAVGKCYLYSSHEGVAAA